VYELAKATSTTEGGGKRGRGVSTGHGRIPAFADSAAQGFPLRDHQMEIGFRGGTRAPAVRDQHRRGRAGRGTFKDQLGLPRCAIRQYASSIVCALVGRLGGGGAIDENLRLTCATNTNGCRDPILERDEREKNRRACRRTRVQAPPIRFAPGGFAISAARNSADARSDRGTKERALQASPALTSRSGWGLFQAGPLSSTTWRRCTG